jgi:hypothetical protein
MTPARNPLVTSTPSVLRLSRWLAVLATGSTAFAGLVNHDFNDNTLPAGDELRGTAAITNGELQLTTATNGQSASYVMQVSDPGQFINSFDASFKILIGNTSSGTPADGLSFSLGQLPAGIFTEGGIDADVNNFTLNSGLTISFDTYGPNDTTAPGFGPGIEITYGQRRLFTAPLASLPGGTLSTGAYVPVNVNWNSNSGLTLSYNGLQLVSGLKLVRSQPGSGAFPAGSQFGFGARTGSLNEQHFVDDIQITTSAQGSALTLNGRFSGTIAGGTIVTAYNLTGVPNSPGAEGVANALDDSITTKYLNFNKSNPGLIIAPPLTLGTTGYKVDGFVLTAANDAPERDPASYILEGSNDGTSWTSISTGAIGTFGNRFTSQEVDFPLSTDAYSQFRLSFPTLFNGPAANSMQVAEVELLGTAVPEPSTIGLAALALGVVVTRRRRA